MLADQLAAAIAETDIGHLHLMPGDKKLKKARATRGGKRATPAGAGTKARGKLPGYSQTVRHMTVGGGY